MTTHLESNTQLVIKIDIQFCTIQRHKTLFKEALGLDLVQGVPSYIFTLLSTVTYKNTCQNTLVHFSPQCKHHYTVNKVGIGILHMASLACSWKRNKNVNKRYCLRKILQRSKDKHKSNTTPGTKCFQSKERPKNKYQESDKKIPFQKQEDIDCDLAAQCFSCKLHALSIKLSQQEAKPKWVSVSRCAEEKKKGFEILLRRIKSMYWAATTELNVLHHAEVHFNTLLGFSEFINNKNDSNSLKIEQKGHCTDSMAHKHPLASQLLWKF